MRVRFLCTREVVMQMYTLYRYGMLGWVEDLPSLAEGRFQHACGSYKTVDTGAQVIER